MLACLLQLITGSISPRRDCRDDEDDDDHEANDDDRRTRDALGNRANTKRIVYFSMSNSRQRFSTSKGAQMRRFKDEN